MRTIKAAGKEQLPSILAVLDAARGIMRADGNLGQWTGGYPSAEVILDDMARGGAFVVEDDGAVTGYFAFLPSPEPTYAEIYGGAWLAPEQPYHVVHRIGSTPDAHGVFRSIMDWCFAQDGNIRVDTHRDNRIMQHCLLSYGFRRCGIIYLRSGDERIAYQRIAETVLQ